MDITTHPRPSHGIHREGSKVGSPPSMGMSRWVLWMQPCGIEAMNVGACTSTPHCPSSSFSRRAISLSSDVNSAASQIQYTTGHWTVRL